MRLTKPSIPLQEKVQAWRADRMLFRQEALLLPDGTPLAEAMRREGWQWQDWTAIDRHGGHVWYSLARGHGKTETAAAEAVTELVLAPPGSLILLCAVDAEQAGIAFTSARGFVQRSPILRGLCRVLKHEIVAPGLDSVIRVIASDAESSWGLRPRLAILDEFVEWRSENHEQYFQSLYTATAKTPGSRLLIITTAGWDRHSLPYQLLESIRDDPSWLVIERRGTLASWLDRRKLEAQKRLLERMGMAHVYKRLHENYWTEASGAFLSAEAVDACFHPLLTEPLRGTEGVSYYGGLDVGHRHDRTAFVVCHLEPDGSGGPGRVVVDRIRWWTPEPGESHLMEVEEVVAKAARDFPGLRVWADVYQTVLLAERLRGRGVRIEERAITAPLRAQLYSLILELVQGRRLVCPPHPELRGELLGLQWRVVGSQLRPDHRAGGHDDLTTALGLAALAAVQGGAQPKQAIAMHLTLPPSWEGLGWDWPTEYERALLERGALEGMMRDMCHVGFPIAHPRGPWSRYGF